MNRRDFIGVGFTALAATACARNPEGAPGVFDGQMAEVTADLLGAQPEAALLAGAPGARRDRLFDRSPAAADLRRAASLRRAAQWRGGIERQTLGPAEQQSFDVIDAHLALMAGAATFSFGRFDPIGGFSPYAADHLQSACITLPHLLSAAIAGGDINEAALHVQRLKVVPAAIDGEIASARADAQAGVIAPAFVLRRLQGGIAAMLSRAPDDTLFLTALKERLVALKQWQDDPALSAVPPGESRVALKLLTEAESVVAGAILPAYRRAYAAFGDLLARATEEPGIGRLPRGGELYRACLSFHAGPDFNADDVHRAAEARVKALRGQLDMMQRSQGLADGEPAQRLAALAVDPRFLYPDAPESRDLILGDVRRETSRMATLLPRVLRKPPIEPLSVLPAQSDEAEGYRSPSLDGKRAGALLVDVAAPGQTARFMLPALAHCEGLPGRHLAALVAAKSEIPLLRKLLPASAARLGWALYAEQLADEMGAYENAPYSRIGSLRALTLGAARAVVDSGVHAQNWSREQASQYLAEAAGVSAVAADAIVAQCAAAPGLACAEEIGRQAIVRLRDEARAALGARFDIRDFHQAVLSLGEVPLAVLDANISAWVSVAKTGKPS